MAYCTPLDVWDALRLTKERSEDFTSVSSGDTLDLSNKYLIDTAFLASQNTDLSSDQTVIITDSSGTVQSTGDYNVDLRDGEIEWNGSNDADLTVRYKTAPIPNRTVQQIIDDKTKQIDERTETTFDGVATTTDVYDGTGLRDDFYPLFNRPVDSVDTVRVNDASSGDSDDWVTQTEGRDEDYIVIKDIGLRWINNETHPTKDVANLEVTYDYGYSGIPDDIKRLCITMTARHLFRENIISANTEGINEFDPRTTEIFLNDEEKVINRYKSFKMHEHIPT